jgi:hypothetical protein
MENMQANDFDIMNRFSTTLLEVLEKIIAPIISSKKEIEIDPYEGCINDLLSENDTLKELQIESIIEKINETYGVPATLIERHIDSPIAVIGIMCIEYRVLKGIKNA